MVCLVISRTPPSLDPEELPLSPILLSSSGSHLIRLRPSVPLSLIAYDATGPNAHRAALEIAQLAPELLSPEICW